MQNDRVLICKPVLQKLQKNAKKQFPCEIIVTWVQTHVTTEANTLTLLAVEAWVILNKWVFALEVFLPALIVCSLNTFFFMLLNLNQIHFASCGFPTAVWKWFMKQLQDHVVAWLCSAGIFSSSPSSLTYRELHLVVLISGHEWPPAFDPLLFEDGNGGQLVLISDHVKGTLLGRLGATREPV